MIASLKLGETVEVWPKPGLRVLEHPYTPGRFLPADGKGVPWSTWIHDRVMDGSVFLTNPRPRPATPAPAPAVHAPEPAPVAHTAPPVATTEPEPAPPAPPKGA